MNGRSRVLGVSCCLALIGTILGSLPAAAASKSQQSLYIKDVRFLDPLANGVSNKDILKLGNEICGDLKSGTSVKHLASILKGSRRRPPWWKPRTFSAPPTRRRY